MNKKLNLIWYWLDRLLLLIIATLIFYLIFLYVETFPSFTETMWLQVGVYLLLGFVAWVMIYEFGASPLISKGSIPLFTSPPIWFIALLAFTFISIFHFKLVHNTRSFWWIYTSTLFFFFTGGIFHSFTIFFRYKKNELGERKTNKSERVNKRFEEISGNFDQLIKWAEKEKPITSVNDDLFVMEVFSKRILGILSPVKSNKRENKYGKTVGITGPYGSGKSSIIKMVQDYIKNPEKLNNKEKTEIDSTHIKDIITCEISGWGLVEGSAVRHIMNLTINELSKYTDCISLKSLPQEYQQALTATGNPFLKTITPFLTRCRDPLTILHQIDNVLTRINKHLVVFLEDINRNKREQVFFNEISALLDGWKECENISFVLAIDSGQGKKEVILKTCEHIITVPQIPRKNVLKSIRTFRKGCKDEFLKDEWKILPDKKSDELFGADRSEYSDYVTETVTAIRNPIDHLAETLCLPRVLKLTFRTVHKQWRYLYGEIDFDNLLIAIAIKHIDQNIYDFININIQQLRDVKAFNDKQRKEIEGKLEKELDKIISTKNYNQPVRELIGFLFPNSPFASDSSIRRELWPVEKDLNFIFNNHPTDYWKKLNRVILSENEVSDKLILTAISKWNKNPKDKCYNGMDITQALLTSNQATDHSLDPGPVFEKIRQFKETINLDVLLKISEEQIDEDLEKYDNKAKSDNSQILDSWFVLLPEEKKEKYFSWFEKVYKKAISVSLNYANAIYHFWLRSGKDNPDFCSRTMELFKNIFKGNPERLIKVLDPEFPFGLCNFIYELNKCAKFNGQKFDWFANTLIETIKLKPAQMIPEVSTMLVDASVGKNSSYGNLAFKEDFAKKMCPQNSVYINLLKQLSRNDVELPKFEPSYSVDKFINKAQSFAKEELEKYNNQ